MATVDAVVALVRTILQDNDDTNYVFPKAVIEQFVAEGARRMATRCFKRAMEDVTPNGTDTSWDLSTLFSATVVEVEGLVASDWESPTLEWDVYGDTLMFGEAPTEQFWVRALVKYADVTELGNELVDGVVYYAASRCLAWLVKRGGSGLRRYLVDQGELSERELSSLAEVYMADFFQIRDENATSAARRI